MGVKRHQFTTKQAAFIAANVKGRGNAELLQMFNEHFNLNLTISQIRAFKKNRKLSSGLDSQFKKGQTAWNKGMKGVNFSGENGKKTQFKKGQTPINYRPVGSERVNVEGYIEVKVADPSKWKLKHRVIWEKENGPIPKGHAIIFGDGNRLNCTLDNLILVTRKQLAILNQKKLIQNDVELTKTGLIVADLYSKIFERKKSKK